MTIQDEILQSRERLSQLKETVKMKNRLSALYTSLIELKREGEKFKKSTEYVPQEILKALNRTYKIAMTAKTSLEVDPDFDHILKPGSSLKIDS